MCDNDKNSREWVKQQQETEEPSAEEINTHHLKNRIFIKLQEENPANLLQQKRTTNIDEEEILANSYQF